MGLVIKSSVWTNQFALEELLPLSSPTSAPADIALAAGPTLISVVPLLDAWRFPATTTRFATVARSLSFIAGTWWLIMFDFNIFYKLQFNFSIKILRLVEFVVYNGPFFLFWQFVVI